MFSVLLLSLFLAKTPAVQTHEGGCWFRDAASVGTESIWVLCEDGRVLHSNSAGDAWKTFQVGGAERLYSIAFADDRRGVVSGADGALFMTADGGATWKKVDTGTSAHLYDSEASGDKFWVVGSLGTILSSTDGAATWSKQEARAYGTLECVYFVNGDTGWAVGSFGNLLKTTDGGQKWTDIDIPGVFERLNSVFFADENRGWITGMGGPLLATEDGGKTWKKMADPGRGWYQGVAFDPKGHGYLAGDAVMTSDDWGKTWKLVPGEMSAWRILLAGKTVWAVGPFAIHVSRDGQKFVEKEPFPASDRLGVSDHTGGGF